MFSNRKFGLEFEHISELNHQQMADELRAAGIAIDPYAIGVGRCREGCYSGWQVKTDGSITTQDDYPTGIELVSPPMTFKDSKKIRLALAVARKFGGVNSSCGLHVHVSAPELARLFDNSAVQQNMSRIWTAIEKVLFTYVPPSRRMSDYCRSGVVWGTKYQAFNTTPLQGRGKTIEFRLHNSTLNPDKALAFTAICIGIIEKMIAGQSLDALDPKHNENVPPKQVKTSKGGEFYIQRADGKWVFENKKLTIEAQSLQEAHKNYFKDLRLTSKEYLPAFHYPHHGNAMSKLCEFVGINGMFRAYAEDRYERMIRKHGIVNELVGGDTITEDEDDYYNEPDYDEADARIAA